MNQTVWVVLDSYDTHDDVIKIFALEEDAIAFVGNRKFCVIEWDVE